MIHENSFVVLKDILKIHDIALIHFAPVTTDYL